MNPTITEATVGELVRDQPNRARIFEEYGIDYCCGGKKSLEQACSESDADFQAVAQKLEQMDSENGTAKENPNAMTLTELADHIEATHHAYLRSELPRLQGIIEKVARVHGDADIRLREVNRVFLGFMEEIYSHMMKEESILFPAVRKLEVGESGFHCGTLANPIRVMEAEHDQAGDALKQFRELTSDFTPPNWACNTYRVMLDSLHQLEQDMHQHIHKENNILFPRALELENSTV